MKKNILYTCAFLLLLTTSCNDWLDVKPQGQKTTEEQFSSYDGFCDALNGCYIKLKDRSIYGEKLSMSNIESMAQLWRRPIKTSLPTDYALSNFDYTNSYAKTAIESIYGNLYNVIAQTNMIINNIDAYASVFSDESKRSVIEGEAYAIRAFCHFDVLRLFGQLPQNAEIQVSLPYAEAVSAADLPAYYSYNEFISKIEADLNRAESLLHENDPIFEHSFTILNTYDSDLIDDEFMFFRQNRFNYWAIKALQARFYLYTGNTTQAYSTAKSIIDATGADGDKLITLSGKSDIANGYLACPSECLMMLNAYSIIDYSPKILGEGTTKVRDDHLAITIDQLNELFDGEEIEGNNRYRKVWNKSMTDPSGNFVPTLKKYFYDKDDEQLKLLKVQLIPLIRLSEMYLIVMETTNDLSEANTLCAEYLLSHDVVFSGDKFTSLNEVKTWVVDEYRREFYGEGQMFYTYKRLGASSMLWRDEPVNESDYSLPLPLTEYNPGI
nr:RagB/SusD family nutrient uptake outer membrane protein [uncultured Draconibacterium sp.]